ncbi:MAG: di-trans,poly-cis-decaprenylcistransferase [Gammaproteobacteria bacterium]|nr:di-trans,poly-cis-decaprenylcistransferase [Gammaproteobacteria bacterium]MDE2348668.1 di-trans,poly-cis-decaprenylcistransferase [Gammaproteobacteria bacterium]
MAMADSPQHVAIIMDGNGRWARSRGLPRVAGHRSSLKVVRRVVEECSDRGVAHLTLFAFSSENWRRPPDEVGMLMSLFLDALVREIDDLHRNQVRLRFIGDRENLGAELLRRMLAAEELTKDNQGLSLLVAVAYGGRWDLVQACRRIAAEAVAGRLAPAGICEQTIADRLALAGVPDPDLLIRTGGESRISNFLLWNLAYTELYFTDVLWPEFSTAHLDAAFEFYARRERRFGMTSAQVAAHSDA